ncbi:arginyl-tRNA synthetase [Desmospora profundinema]|uniref:Arginine--tRNA ligase n=1 Tax=Desmospora profundinema TaxID=1571184 RepID=A0ABU1IMR7_9BACL|nr:arginyl-tRNA synthetase [Desmospora profundinema]
MKQEWKAFARAIAAASKREASVEEVEALLERPRDPAHGDVAFPCFRWAKKWKQPPQAIAQMLAEQISHPKWEQVEAVGPYVNVRFNRERVTQEVLSRILHEQGSYGSSYRGEGKTVVIDFSSPNIAKPFSMGHLRSTVIGHSLVRIARKQGFRVEGVNHLGDWGTQFGKLIAAFRRWGSEEAVKADPIRELLRLYVRFHEEMTANPELEEEGRRWFKKLEDGDSEAQHLWHWFRKESLREFHRIYDWMGVTIDHDHGEAFYNDRMGPVVDALREMGLLRHSEGAQVVDLTEEGLPPCLITKSDGATLYATRDLAAALYRRETFGFDYAWYVTGREQAVHFRQVFAVLKRMGHVWADRMEHIPFGMMLQNGKKMSTRKGNVVLLEEVLQQAVARAQKLIEQKNGTLADPEETARQVGIGAVIFHDLKHDRLHDVEFSLDQMLHFDGETGPYLQYTHARACSLLRKGKAANVVPGSLSLPVVMEESWRVVTYLSDFPAVAAQAFDYRDPSRIARYLLQLGQAFNHYYAHVHILQEDGGKEARLALVSAVAIVLKEGLHLLGMEAPEEV